MDIERLGSKAKLAMVVEVFSISLKVAESKSMGHCLEHLTKEIEMRYGGLKAFIGCWESWDGDPETGLMEKYYRPETLRSMLLSVSDGQLTEFLSTFKYHFYWLGISLLGSASNIALNEYQLDGNEDLWVNPPRFLIESSELEVFVLDIDILSIRAQNEENFTILREIAMKFGKPLASH